MTIDHNTVSMQIVDTRSISFSSNFYMLPFPSTFSLELTGYLTCTVVIGEEGTIANKIVVVDKIGHLGPPPCHCRGLLCKIVWYPVFTTALTPISAQFPISTNNFHLGPPINPTDNCYYILSLVISTKKGGTISSTCN